MKREVHLQGLRQRHRKDSKEARHSLADLLHEVHKRQNLVKKGVQLQVVPHHHPGDLLNKSLQQERLLHLIEAQKRLHQGVVEKEVEEETNP